jgi:hypothetical protein
MQPLQRWLVEAVQSKQEVLMRFSFVIAASALMLAGLAACHQEGPTERAGKSLDNAGQSISDTLSPPGPAQSTGRKIDRALGN